MVGVGIFLVLYVSFDEIDGVYYEGIKSIGDIVESEVVGGFEILGEEFLVG